MPAFIPNIIITANSHRVGDEIHGVVLEDGEVAFTDDMANEFASARLPDEWDYLGVSKAFVFQVLADTPAIRRTVCDLVLLHRGRYGTTRVHTEGSGSIITWAEAGCVPPSDAATEDSAAEVEPESVPDVVKTKKKQVKKPVRKNAPEKAATFHKDKT